MQLIKRLIENDYHNAGDILRSIFLNENNTHAAT